MNEELLKSIIKSKLKIAEKMVDHLPDEVSGEIKRFGKMVIEGINEFSQDKQENPQKKQSKELEKIPIE
jgi:hypothetical protein